MARRWAPNPQMLGKIKVDDRGRFVVNVKPDARYYGGYSTATYRSFDKAKRRADKVIAKEQARLEKIRIAREIVENFENS